MDNRQRILFTFDAFVERAEIRDLSDLAILFWQQWSKARPTWRLHILQGFQYQPCVGVPFWMFVHGHKEPGTVCGAPVSSLVISQCEPFGGGTHQEIHQIIFCSWPEDIVTRGIDWLLNVFDWQQLCWCRLVHILHQGFWRHSYQGSLNQTCCLLF